MVILDGRLGLSKDCQSLFLLITLSLLKRRISSLRVIKRVWSPPLQLVLIHTLVPSTRPHAARLTRSKFGLLNTPLFSYVNSLAVSRTHTRHTTSLPLIQFETSYGTEIENFTNEYTLADVKIHSSIKQIDKADRTRRFEAFLQPSARTHT